MWTLYDVKTSPEVSETAKTRKHKASPSTESRLEVGMTTSKWCLSLGLGGQSSRTTDIKRSEG